MNEEITVPKPSNPEPQPEFLGKIAALESRVSALENGLYDALKALSALSVETGRLATIPEKLNNDLGKLLAEPSRY